MGKSQGQHNQWTPWTHLGLSYFKEFHKDQFFGPILFNIYINDIFIALKGTDICNFTDDITPYVCDLNLKPVLKTLQNYSELAIA